VKYNLKNKITVEDGIAIVEKYQSGFGTATVARLLSFKTHCVERFIRDSGLMRERKLGASIAMKNLAMQNAKLSNMGRK
jgi:hypothetical protein